MVFCFEKVSGYVVHPHRSAGQSKEEACQPTESGDGGEEAKNYTSVAPTMWLGAQNGWSVTQPKSLTVFIVTLD